MMQRLSIVFVFCLMLQLVAAGAVRAGDATSFDPTRVAVVAKGAGGVPVGTIVAWPVAKNPEDMDKWLECNGQTVSATVYPELFALLGGRVPDFRGLFLRGIDQGRGLDPGRMLGNYQEDAFGSHTHYSHGSRHGRYGANPGGSFFSADGDTDWGYGAKALQYTGGSETRPKNMAVRYFIRACL